MVLYGGIEHRMRNLSTLVEGLVKKDVYLFTTLIPKHVSKIQELFSDEIRQMIRRSKLPGRSEQPLLEDLSEEQPTAHLAFAFSTKA